MFLKGKTCGFQKMTSQMQLTFLIAATASVVVFGVIILLWFSGLEKNPLTHFLVALFLLKVWNVKTLFLTSRGKSRKQSIHVIKLEQQAGQKEETPLWLQ